MFVCLFCFLAHLLLPLFSSRAMKARRITSGCAFVQQHARFDYFHKIFPFFVFVCLHFFFILFFCSQHFFFFLLLFWAVQKVAAVYTVDTMTMELVVALSSCHPLRNVEVGVLFKKIKLCLAPASVCGCHTLLLRFFKKNSHCISKKLPRSHADNASACRMPCGENGSCRCLCLFRIRYRNNRLKK